jgi:hypothetical protein
VLLQCCLLSSVACYYACWTPRLPPPTFFAPQHNSYLIDLLPASICFLLASGLFVVGLALDIPQLKEQQGEARAADPDVAAELLRNMWRRYLALAINLAGGAVSVREEGPGVGTLVA